MFSASLKWLISTVVMICYTTSFVKTMEDQRLLYIIKKISDDQLNLTCLAKEDDRFEGLSLTGPENDWDFGQSNNKPLQNIALNNRAYNFDLPPVLDQQWEDFPIHGPNDTFVLPKNEYLWISTRYKSDLRMIDSINFGNKFQLISIVKAHTLQWVHFQIRANSTHITFRSDKFSNDYHWELITDANENNFTINSVYKLHRYNVVKVNEEINKEMSETIAIDNIKFDGVGGIHILLSYYLLCSCNATIKVVDHEGERIGSLFNLDQDGIHWKTIEINIPTTKSSESEVPKDQVDIVITLVPKPSSSVLFVVRNILVRKNSTDHSISKTIKSMDLSHYTCKSMQSNLVITSDVNITPPTILGTMRFPQSKLCYLDEKCYCSTGSKGEMCDEACDDGFWGDCIKKCDCCNVNNTCDKGNGSCDIGENCEKVRKIQGIELNSSATTVTGKVLVEKDSLQKGIKAIKIEYCITSQNNWTHPKYEENLDNPNINITNLSPNKKYTIRALLCNAVRCFEEYRFEKQISTMCDQPIPSELELDIHQYNVSLIHSNYSSKKGSCPEFLSLRIGNKTRNDTIDGLTAYSEHHVYILFQESTIDERSIFTKKAQPSSVGQLQFHENNNSITWMEPQNPNGNLGDYVVKISRQRKSILCDNEEKNTPYNRSNLQLHIKVIPFAKYKVIVQASNEEGLGHEEQISFETAPKIEIGDDERPINFHINETHFQMEVKGCDTVYDSWIIYEIIFTCLNCVNLQRISTVNVSYTKESNYTRPLSISLEPFTNYTVQPSIYRNKNSAVSIKNETLTTLPKCPPAVRHLEVYSLSNNSISVRWKAPNPPHGVLEKLLYKDQKGNRKTFKITNEKKCSLWEDYKKYFCILIGNISEHSFPIDVIAKNVNTSNCKENVTIKGIKLQESESEAPRNLNIQWKNEQMEELELTWNHPNKTNGQLKHFKINLNSSEDTSDNIEKEFFISNESNFYNYSIRNLTACRKYIVHVIPFNEVIGLSAKFSEEIITPPPYPHIDDKTKYSLDGQNFTIYIPSVKNTTKNSSIIMIMSKGDCSSSSDSQQLIASKEIVKDIMEDVINKTFKVDVTNDLKIANISMHKKYSVTILVTNKFEGISRNSSLCLTKAMVKTATIYSSLLLWIGLIGFSVILIICVFLICKYGPIQIYQKIQSKISRNRFNNNMPRRRQMSYNSSEYINLKHTVSYENQPLIPKSNAIQTKNFLKYLKSALKYGEECTLYTDFDSIPLKIYDFSDTAIKNKIKNRYLNILPYEETRVILKSKRYINASFIQGYKTDKVYIATQGPKLQSVDDFWEMIFEYNVKLIAMLCPLKEDGKVKCDQYWPDYRNSILNSRNLEIEFVSETNYNVYIERQFHLKYDEMQTTVIQLQFTAWMDHHIPSTSQFLYEFLETFHELHDYSSPAVVHCSAGAGRTGTLILCDHLLRMEKETSTLDFPLVLCNLRKDRCQMVQTKQQYHFAHVVIYEYLCVGKNRIICDDNFEENILKTVESKEIISKQLSLFDYIYAIDVPTFNQKLVSLEQEDMAKNRDNKIIPTTSGMIYLQTSKLATSTYINAVTVDGYNQVEKFIVTQQPLISSKGSTLADYWRLVIQTKPDVIVSLQSQVINFYPIENTLLIDSYITLTCIKQYRNEISTTFTVKIEMDNEEYAINIIQANLKLEAAEEGLIDFVKFYNNFRSNYSNKEFKVLVTCLNGSDLSGIFVALDYIIEKMLQQEICDVFLAVRTVRRNRPSFIMSEEQYRFLYQCALEIKKKMCAIYSNIS